MLKAPSIAFLFLMCIGCNHFTYGAAANGSAAAAAAAVAPTTDIATLLFAAEPKAGNRKARREHKQKQDVEKKDTVKKPAPKKIVNARPGIAELTKKVQNGLAKVAIARSQQATQQALVSARNYIETLIPEIQTLALKSPQNKNDETEQSIIKKSESFSSAFAAIGGASDKDRTKLINKAITEFQALKTLLDKPKPAAVK